MREGVLDAINVYRALHGVPALVLDENLTQQAQSHAEYIKEMQDPEEKSAGHGVDYWESTFWNLKIPTYEHKIGEIVEQWYGENLNYNYETGEKIEEDLPVEHFTALVWKSATKIGVGFAGGVEDYFGMEGVGLYAVVQFSPNANVQGEYMENVLPAVGSEPEPLVTIAESEPALTQDPGN